jgi:hypothetical protein
MLLSSVTIKLRRRKCEFIGRSNRNASASSLPS